MKLTNHNSVSQINVECVIIPCEIDHPAYFIHLLKLEVKICFSLFGKIDVDHLNLTWNSWPGLVKRGN